MEATTIKLEGELLAALNIVKPDGLRCLQLTTFSRPDR
jgi:hypothetical protein